jgi:hypothetical protein
MASQKNAVYAGTALTTNWSIKNFRVVANYITISDDAQRMIDSEIGGVFRWSSTLWRSFNYTTSAVSGGDSVLIPWRTSSMKTLYSIWRPTTNIENYLANFQSARVNPFCELATSNACSIYLQVGSQSIPQVPIRSTPEIFCELLKANHALQNPNSWDTNLQAGEYDATATPLTTGSFVFGLNLESFTNKSGVIHSGVNTLNTQTILNTNHPVFGATGAVLGACYITSYVNYDAIIEVANGIVDTNY